MIKNILKLIVKEYFVNDKHSFFEKEGEIHDCGDIGRWLSPVLKRIEKKKMEITDQNINSILALSSDKKRVLKLEIKPHPRKEMRLFDEVKVLKTLNEKKCVTAPNIIESGRIAYKDIETLLRKVGIQSGDSYDYMIMDYIAPNTGYRISDVIIAILEQKELGVYHGDIKPSNICFDKETGVCKFIDYDQAEFIPKNVQELNSQDYLQWCDGREGEKYGKECNSWTRNFKGLNYNRHIKHLFRDNIFNIATTTPYKKQVTTNTDDGVYHTIKSKLIYADGIRDFHSRFSLLDSVEFKANEKVLDIGCNAGLLTHYLYGRNCRPTGIEMDPWIVSSAKIIANILKVECKYKAIDLDDAKYLEEFDTICLFSVIHHTQKLEENGKKIANSCNRILIECRLSENGHKPCKDKNGKTVWTRSSIWNYSDEVSLKEGMSELFPGFCVKRTLGKADRNRYVFEMIKE
jgi:2-polyprenyl-3-methyl-5-hydroxy-6-metoxy-1,4-benzoquinol methylase